MTDYDKLILEVSTDGRITPEDALKQSAAILRHHLDVFDQISEEQIEFEEVILRKLVRNKIGLRTYWYERK